MISVYVETLYGVKLRPDCCITVLTQKEHNSYSFRKVLAVFSIYYCTCTCIRVYVYNVNINFTLHVFNVYQTIRINFNSYYGIDRLFIVKILY